MKTIITWSHIQKQTRGVIDILKTPGYVSLIGGPPGIGKTYLWLNTCATKEGCVFKSFIVYNLIN
ncbi:MAG: hypothetical protein ACP5FU_06700, partial [Nitrososphaeria archaeon]